MYDLDFLGTGWRFPVQVDESSGKIAVALHEQDIAQSVRIILHTAKGERLMRPDFGSTLRSYVFASMTLAALSVLAEELKTSLTTWEPRIRDVEVTVDAKQAQGRIEISVGYSVRLTNNRYNLVFPFYLNEG